MAGLLMQYLNMKGRGNISKNCEAGIQFTRDLSEISAVVWMIGLLQSDVFRCFFPTSISTLKSLQRFPYDYKSQFFQKIV